MPRVLVTPIEVVYQQGACQEVLQQAGFEIAYPPRGVRLYDPDLLIEHLAGVDAMIAGMEPLNRRVLEASKLRAVARMGVGYDAIDVPAATERGVAVTISPGTNQVSVAEHTLALLLGVMRGFPQRDQSVRRGDWSRKLLPRLAGKTIGLVGLGRIGKAVVPRARALELTVIAHDPQADRDYAAAHGVRLCSLEELLASADVVSLHLPCTPQTTRMIDRAALARMRPGAILINTARGGLVDEDALAEALASGHLGGAGLDAFVVEPLPTTSPLLKYENVLLSPHTAGVDQESIVAMARLAAECVVALYRTGRAPEGCLVNPDLGPDCALGLNAERESHQGGLGAHHPGRYPGRWRFATHKGMSMTTIFTVWIFKQDSTLECQFEEFADAKRFAAAAEKITDVKQVGITNNESPEYLSVWTRPV